MFDGLVQAKQMDDMSHRGQPEVGLRKPNDLCTRVSEERGDGEGPGSQALCTCVDEDCLVRG